ncbi:MAG TPA: class I SAM-dependent methyltransferase, partial [Anaerovoracaceae bacterium]|nr:class I SAM-dependent methyltransferase [Anaerovoracaceae bacterium]
WKDSFKRMNNFNEKSRRSYNAKADHYDDTMEGRYTLEFKRRLMEEINIGQGAHVLDVACGNGTLLKMMEGRFGIVGYGIDISEKMIENARVKNSGMVFKAAGCENVPFDDQSFNLLTVCAAYHHFPDVAAFAAEAYRLLKSEGYLYIADVYYSAFPRFLCNLFLPLSKDGDVKFYSPEEIIELFEHLGFKKGKVMISGHIQIVTMQKIQH